MTEEPVFSLSNAIATENALLVQRIDLLTKKIEMVEESSKKALDTLQTELTSIKESQEKSWLKDRKFWAGISAVPLLLIGGWVVKTTSGDAAALRLMHRALGTEPALSSALKDDDSDFTKQVEKTIGKGVEAKTGVVGVALENMLKDKQVIRESTLVPTLTKELKEYVGAKHAAFLSVGLVNPKNARAVPCSFDGAQPKLCLDASAGQVKAATVIFGANSGKKVDVELGINVRQYNISSDGKFDPSKSTDVTSSSKVSELIEIKIDETGKLAFSPVPGQMQRYTLDGVTYIFEHYIAKAQVLGSQSFPMHSVSVEMPANVPADKVVNIAVVISQSN